MVAIFIVRNDIKLSYAETTAGNPTGVVAPTQTRKGVLQMNREFLEGLGLEKDAINAIMAKHGSAIGAKETEISNLQNEKQKLDDKITQLENAGGDDGDEALKTELETLKSDKQKLEQQLTDQAKQHKLEMYVGSLGTKDPEYVMAKLADVELKDDEFVGIDERVDELKEKHPLLFEAEEPNPKNPKKWSQGGVNTVNNGSLTREEIMQEKDASKRQKLILENKQLFR